MSFRYMLNEEMKELLNKSDYLKANYKDQIKSKIQYKVLLRREVSKHFYNALYLHDTFFSVMI